MIKKLDIKSTDVLERVYSVFQSSYAVEAELLNVIDFPPLKRAMDSYSNNEAQFYGFWENDEIVGVIETTTDEFITEINSLVVHPEYFRQGIAQKLIKFVIDSFDSKNIMVETGAKNNPAIELYKKLGFAEMEQWDTDFGIRKIKLNRPK